MAFHFIKVSHKNVTSIKLGADRYLETYQSIMPHYGIKICRTDPVAYILNKVMLLFILF